MKKILAIAISTLAFTNTANAGVEIYDADGLKVKLGGRIQLRTQFEDGEQKDTSRARLNLGFEQKVTDEFTGVAYWEEEFKRHDTLKTKEMWVGGKYNNHTFLYGLQDGAVKMVQAFTDMGPQWGTNDGQFVEVGMAGDGVKELGESFLYIGDFDELEVQANVTPEKDQDLAGNGENFYGYAVAAKYKLPKGFAVGAGYADQTTKSVDSANPFEEFDSNGFTVGGSYTVGKMYFGALYTGGEKGENDFSGYEFATKYTFNKQWQVMAQYQNHEETIDGNNIDEVDQYVIGFKWNLATKYQITGTYKIDQLENKNDVAELSWRIKI